ncbi:MAG: hypothetical protein AB8G95_30735 [Anaerolineae bacterium]
MNQKNSRSVSFILATLFLLPACALLNTAETTATSISQTSPTRDQPILVLSPDTVPTAIVEAEPTLTQSPIPPTEVATVPATEAVPSQSLTSSPKTNVIENLCAGLITDQLPHPMSAAAKPNVGDAFIDPAFGTTIRRITDAGPDNVIKPMYSTIPAWNADESLIILYETGVGHRLYDGRTYTFIQQLDINPSDLEHVYWHATDPDIFYYPESRQLSGEWVENLVAYQVSNSTKTIVRNFAADGVTGYKFGFGRDPMYSSWDSRFFGLAATEADTVYTYDRVNDTIIKQAPADDRPAAPMPSPSGQFYFWDGEVYDQNLTFLRTLGLGNAYEHSSIGTMNGRDTYFSVQFGSGPNSEIGTLIAHDLATAESTVLIGESNGYPYPPSGTHISPLSINNPGYVAVSIIGFQADGQTLLDNELVLVNANTGTVCRVAHHRSVRGSQGYWAEPHVVISPSGTRMIFGSDWGGSNTVDTYVVELPSYKPAVTIPLPFSVFLPATTQANS